MAFRSLDWGLGAGAALLLGGGLYLAGATPSLTTGETRAPEIDYRALVTTFTSADAAFPLPNNDVLRVSFRRNETLVDVLQRVGASREDTNGAVNALSGLLDLRRSRPGDEITAYLDQEPETGRVQLSGVSLQPEAGRTITIARTSFGGWAARDLRARLTPDVGHVDGVIEQSIYDTALENGAGDQQVVDFANIFAYDIDFQREIWAGDRFEMLFETFADERGETVSRGELLYASLKARTVNRAFYRYTTADSGETDYFDATGESVRKFLMKTPINGARLSSGFGTRRHPVLGYTKMHKGTDFAAPRGTPIYAAGSGVIEKAGPWSTFGNYVRIRHANGYKTAYAHMNGFAKGMKAGAKVRQGQVIGYVGTTGRSTGPHLHYEVYVDGKAVNPMGLKLKTGRKLDGAELARFQEERARIDALRAAKTGPLMASADLPADNPARMR